MCPWAPLQGPLYVGLPSALGRAALPTQHSSDAPNGQRTKNKDLPPQIHYVDPRTLPGTYTLLSWYLPSRVGNPLYEQAWPTNTHCSTGPPERAGGRTRSVHSFPRETWGDSPPWHEQACACIPQHKRRLGPDENTHVVRLSVQGGMYPPHVSVFTCTVCRYFSRLVVSTPLAGMYPTVSVS